jgi:hypothetical protein
MNAKPALVLLAALIIGGTPPVFAEQDAHQHMSMMEHAPDARQVLDFPAPMRMHMLSNMRSHLDALSQILAALSSGEGAKAGEIARARLGLQSPGAAACNPKAAGETGAENPMAMMMAHHMPEEMRALGYAMHESASDFAVEAEKTSKGGNPTAALAALSKVTENCVGCHTAYRLK